MNNVSFDPPRQARIKGPVFVLRCETLKRMGLLRQEFRAVEQTPDGSKVIVHRGDLSPSAPNPFPLRSDIVEFTTEES